MDGGDCRGSVRTGDVGPLRLIRLRVAFWRLYYGACRAMLDDAWERDVALANRWARGWIRLKIAAGCVAFWLFFKIEQDWAIEEALRDWTWPY